MAVAPVGADVGREMPVQSRSGKPPSHSVVAAVDLGSNSFHMTVAHLLDGQLRPLDRLKERVQLAAGLYDDNRLSAAAMQRGLDCLRRFGERLHGLPADAVRAVGTNTLRQASNAAVFLPQAEAALGFPIEVISGEDEARLIYAGVAYRHVERTRRLVIDIGGGSTELIIGTGFEPQLLGSVQLGCVAFQRRFFADDQLSAEAFLAAEQQCRHTLRDLGDRYRQCGWEYALGSSGTILSIADILRARGSDGTITLAHLQALRDEVIAAGHAARLQLPSLSDDRRAIFAPGLAILLACFESLGIARMQATDAALREGLLYTLINRAD